MNRFLIKKFDTDENCHITALVWADDAEMLDACLTLGAGSLHHIGIIDGTDKVTTRELTLYISPFITATDFVTEFEKSAKNIGAEVFFSTQARKNLISISSDVKFEKVYAFDEVIDGNLGRLRSESARIF